MKHFGKTAIALACLLGLPGAGYSQDVFIGPDRGVIIQDDLPKGRNWIRMSGTVESFFGDTLTIMAGEERVEIDTDDLDLDAISDILNEGDTITVTGELDDGGIGNQIDAWRITAVTEYGPVVVSR